jgi:hypothetical protein
VTATAHVGARALDDDVGTHPGTVVGQFAADDDVALRHPAGASRVLGLRGWIESRGLRHADDIERVASSDPRSAVSRPAGPSFLKQPVIYQTSK